MKKWYILLISIIILFFAFQLKPAEKSVLGSRTLTPTPSPLYLPHGIVIEVAYTPSPLYILAVEVKKEDTLNLIPNFKEKEFGAKIAYAHECRVAINGGFYKGDATPLGLFMTQGKLIGKSAKSSIANGFFWQEQGMIRTIGKEIPPLPETLDFILQSGPYMRILKQKLSFLNDTRTRRSLIGFDRSNRLFFISIKGKENNFHGPLLADVPLLFSRKEVQEMLPLTTLLNLDGGGASFFYSQDEDATFSLSEISPVGSILCAKQSL